jgi:3-polyprenyl-4-hydroxybenzoate decarboxylase
MKSGSKLGIDATKLLPGEVFKRPWPITAMQAK